ncbi:MAG: hypothetical protein SCJ94_10120 [Bacillota bacterium]|nr:hypothetical protein [Bacillota bacterium]MDW7730343.1 hypothetical protein [Bacillota bacterium]
MFKYHRPHKEPVKWGVQFGLIYGFTYALGWTIIHYVQHREFTWVGLISGILAFFISVGLGVFIKWYQQNELKKGRDKNEL